MKETIEFLAWFFLVPLLAIGGLMLWTVIGFFIIESVRHVYSKIRNKTK